METQHIEAIVIGGSAGALDALLTMLPSVRADFPVPIAIVIHLSPGKPSFAAQLFGANCRLTVKEAEDKEPVLPGTVYLAPPNYHLLVEKRRYFSLSADEPVHFSRPAIDVLFESAADAYGPELVGVLLTGANQDGALGLLRVHQMGGVSLVQAPDSAVARTMPEAALRLFRPDQLFSPKELGSVLERLVASSVTKGELR